FGEGDVPGDAGFGEQLHPVEHDVDVDGLAFDRPVVAKNLNAINEIDDAINLLAHQAREGQLFGGDRLFEQLSGATDAREGVLDLVRQHRGETRHRPRRTPADELAVDLVGHRALLKKQGDTGIYVGNRAREDVDDAIVRGVAEADGADMDAVFGHRRAALAHRLRQADNGRTEGDDIVQALPAEHAERGAEEPLRGVI